jgi:hypothetical protein
MTAPLSWAGESVSALSKSGRAVHFMNEVFRHGKSLAFIADGSLVMKGGEIARGQCQGRCDHRRRR